MAKWQSTCICGDTMDVEANSKEEAIDKTIELLRFYLHSPSNKKFKIDRARREYPLTVYKLIFDK